MRILAALTRTGYRHTNDGRRVYVPFSLVPVRGRRVCYVIEDAETASFERRLGVSFAFVILSPLAGALAGIAVTPWMLILLALLVPWITLRFVVTRGLPRAFLGPEDLAPVDPTITWRSQVQEIGPPLLWALLLQTVAFSAVAAGVVAATGFVVAWVLLLIFATISILLAIGLRTARRGQTQQSRKF